MRMTVQRVHRATLSVNEEQISQIGMGYLVLVGFTHTDTKELVERLVNRVVNMRIFRDADGKLNNSLEQVGGEVMVVSNFTLYGDCFTNRRPDFSRSAKYDFALPLYEYTIECFKNRLGHCAHGVFGAHMHIDMISDGPVTLWLEKDA